MKIQNKAGIYVYYIDTSAFNKTLCNYYFESFNEFFRSFGQLEIYYLCGPSEKIYQKADAGIKYLFSLQNLPKLNFAVYNENAKYFSKIELLARYKDWLYERLKLNKRHNYNRRQGRKKGAYGHYVKIKTIKTVRALVNGDYELDIIINLRKKSIPPNAWDREKISHNDKSWKTQSKRKHHWK
jgi:hypothetical protein